MSTTGAQTRRETFYEAHRRYRRAGWRFSVLSAVAVVILGVPLSLIVSPLVLALGLIVLDIVNLVVPMPDPAADIGRFLIRMSDASDSAPVPVPVTEVVTVAVGLLVPGMLAMAAAWLCVRRLFLSSAAGAVALAAGARAPASDTFEERQLVNLVEEMAIAAGVPAPRVLVLDGEITNAAVVGRSIDDVTLLIPRRLLDDLGRAPTGALVADLLASAVNGDLRAALVIASVFQTFDLVGAVLAAPDSRRTRRVLWRLGRLALRRRPRAGYDHEAHYIAAELAEVGGMADDEQTGGLLTFPFLVASIAYMLTRLFVGGMFVTPVMAALWRRRRLLADATAVGLTRDPDALARVLEHLQQRATVVPAGPWAHLFLIGPEVAHTRAQRRMHDRLDALRAEPGHDRPAGATWRDRYRATREGQVEYQQAVDTSSGGSDSLSTMGLETFLPRPDVRLRRLAAMGASIDPAHLRAPQRRFRPAPASTGGRAKHAALWLAGWTVSVVLVAVLLVLGVLLFALLGVMIYLALLFQVLLFVPLVAGVRFLLRGLAGG